jgi:hypothetical protein
MKAETIEKILNFLQNNEGKGLPKKWFDSIEKIKLIKELENHPDGTQYRYEGNLFLSNSNITKLPNDLYVGGDLMLFNCKQLTKLSGNLYVVRNLNLYGCDQLTKLPDNLHVDGYLSLENCKQLTELPDNLYVTREVYLENTPIAMRYTVEEIREIVASTGGELKGEIYI